MVIFYYATLFKYTGQGPMWNTIIVPEVEDCRANWWTNLLYISNYIEVDHMCMVHSWYLPCDFHYFIVAVLLCIFIHKSKTIGLPLLGFATFLAFLIPFLMVFLLKRSALIFFYPDFLRMPKQQEDFGSIYSKSHTRAAPYFIGMIAGYIYHRMKGSGKCLKRVYSHIILVISLLLMVSSIITGVIFYNPDYEYDRIGSALYASLHRVVWSVGSVGVLYVASYGHTKYIYRFLSWKPWIPLSKLVYGAYLVHMQFQLRAVARKGGADVITYFDVISYSFSDIVLAFGTSFLLYLVIEAPFRNIFTLLMVTSDHATKKNNTRQTSENVNETTCDSHL
nr:nose resistant to fluoxetine protein 6-like [Leptinotarsa decemlineata]